MSGRNVFLNGDHDLAHGGGAAARAVPVAAWRFGGIASASDRGFPIGWRGVAAGAGLCLAAWLLAPGLPRHPHRAAVVTAPVIDALPADGVEPARIERIATIAAGADLTRLLERAGVGSDEAEHAAALVAGAAALGDIAPGTRITLTLGPRPNRLVARPLERLDLRARLDLALTVSRDRGALALSRRVIAVEHHPRRLAGLAGRSLLRSVLAAGAPAGVADAYLSVLATRLSPVRDIAAADRFDLVFARDRAATGEEQIGDLSYVALDRGDRQLRLLRWGEGTAARWYDADGVGEGHGAPAMPVAGPVTSRFGMRFHPILGFSRMHWGVDIGAPIGTPVVAIADGVVRTAGWAGGYGNCVRLAHDGAVASGYGHLSRIAVAAGQRVVRGQLIGFVGSTGLSTGPHLHWEIWRNGVAVDPLTVALDRPDRLSGAALAAFRARLAAVTALRAG